MSIFMCNWIHRNCKICISENCWNWRRISEIQKMTIKLSFLCIILQWKVIWLSFLDIYLWFFFNHFYRYNPIYSLIKKKKKREVPRALFLYLSELTWLSWCRREQHQHPLQWFAWPEGRGIRRLGHLLLTMDHCQESSQPHRPGGLPHPSRLQDYHHPLDKIQSFPSPY